MATKDKTKKKLSLFHRNKGRYGKSLKLLEFLKKINPEAQIEFTKKEFQLLEERIYSIDYLYVVKGKKMLKNDFIKAQKEFKFHMSSPSYPYQDNVMSFDEFVLLFSYSQFLKCDYHTPQRRLEMWKYLNDHGENLPDSDEFLSRVNVFFMGISMYISSIFDRYFCYSVTVFNNRHGIRKFGLRVFVEVAYASKRIFRDDNTKRMAYRFIHAYAFAIHNVVYNLSHFTNNPKHEKVPVYIQKHAAQRVKERLNLDTAHIDVTFYLLYILFNWRDIIRTHNRFLVPLDCSGVRLGYFVGVLIDDCLVLRTFLFITHKQTPEGRKLSQLAMLQAKDIEYWKIDQLEHLQNLDKEEYPRIYSLFEKAGCANIFNYKRSDQEELTRMPNYFDGFKEYIQKGSDEVLSPV